MSAPWPIDVEFNRFEVDLTRNEIIAAAKAVAFNAGAVNVENRTLSTVRFAIHQWDLLNPNSTGDPNEHDVVAILVEAERQTERIRRFLGIPAAVR